MPQQPCEHLTAVTVVKQADHATCDECVKIGGQWVNLRICQTCGAVLCCDNSPNRHARAHANASGHPVIASAKPGERWIYCYTDDVTAVY